MPTILLPAKVESCPLAMQFLREHLTAAYAPVLQLMELSVEELLVNVAHYAYAMDAGAGEDGAALTAEGAAVEAAAANKIAGAAYSEAASRWGMLELGVRTVSMDDVPYLCVWIRDWGKPYDPFMESPRPDTDLDAEDRPIGGLGVHLVKNVSAHHCYSGNDGTNTIELYFAMPATA